MLFWLKYVYQTVFIKLLLGFYTVFSKKKDPAEMVRRKLSNRNFTWKPGRPTKVFAVFAVNNWEHLLLDPLRELGEVHHFKWTDGKFFFSDKAEWRQFRQNLNKRLLSAFNRVYDDKSNIIIFIYASDFSISSESIDAMRRQNTMMVSFCWDDLLYFKGSVKGQPVGIAALSRKVDLNLTMSPEVIPRYTYYGSPAFFWRGAPIDTAETDMVLPATSPFYVLFIGSAYGWRKKFVDELQNRGVDIVCYGEGWENGPVSEDDMQELIAKAPLTLGFSNVAYTKYITTVKGRVFEVPMYGGLLLVQDARGLSEYFESGKEMYTFTNMDECYRKIQYISQHPEEARAVRKAGHARMLRTGTWRSRFVYLDNLLKKLTGEEYK